VRTRAQASLEDIGVVRQHELFEREAQRLGKAPPVIDGADVVADPHKTLSRLCEALDVPFAEAMLGWPAGPRESDGVWAPAWYQAVERSTRFTPPPARGPYQLSDELRRIAERARPHYEALAAFRIAT
jgi:hypothetical protein